jgi:hypothetical protein
MKSSTLTNTLISLFQIQRTVAIEGAPGGGKTTLVHQAAQRLRVPIIEKHMPTMLVEDFGVPYPDEDGTLKYKIPDWFPVKGKAPEKGILLFDDRNQASPDLQKVLANICQARNLHGTPLPDGWMVISTGNRQSDRAGANRVLSHLRNRETVLEYETNLDDWTAWAVEAKIHPSVVSFARFRPELLHEFDPSRDANPTPRSWAEGISPLIGLVPKDAEFECFKGAIGEGAAVEFAGFLRVYEDLPTIESIVANPTKVAVPSNLATLYALSGAIASAMNEDNIPQLAAFISRIPPEFSVLAMSLAIKRDSSLASTSEFAQWAADNTSVLF